MGDLELAIAGGASSNKGSQSDPTTYRREYEEKLEGLRRMSFINDSLQTLSWFLGFCALSWASAVLLGAYVTQLVKKDYYEVFILLVVEGIRFGLVVLYRSLGSYSLGPFLRWIFRSAEFALPLGMGSFALFGLLPIEYNFFNHPKSSPSSTSIHNTSFITKINAQVPSSPLVPVPYDNLGVSLHIFYACILFNALILLFRNIFNSFMRIKYMIPRSTSLCKYHDKMLSGGGTDTWMRVGVDLDFAFTMQSYDYRKGPVSAMSASKMCETYGDLVWFLYFHERGFEVAEKVIAEGDVYMQEAATNMVGYWAVLETLEEVKACGRTALRLHKGMLCKLANMAAESYGPVGIAAARTIALLLMSDPVGICTSSVRSQSGQNIVAIILARLEQLSSLLASSSHQPSSLQEESCTHIHALRKLLLHLDEIPADTIMDGMAKLLWDMKENFHVQEQNSDLNGSQLEIHLSNLLPSLVSNFYDDIKKNLLATMPKAQGRIKYQIVKIFLMDMTIPLFSFFIGFLSYALISHL